MPAALDVNRDEVRMLAVQYGVREAARMCGLNEDTVATWSANEGWLKLLPRSVPLPPTVVQPSSITSKPADAQASAMRSDAIAGRASALRLGRRSLARLERCDDDELITPEVTDAALKWTKQHATAAGYGSDVRVEVTAQQFGKADCITVEAELVSDPVETVSEVNTTDVG